MPIVTEYPIEEAPSRRILSFGVTSSPYAHIYKTKDESVHYFVRVNDRTQLVDDLIPRLLELKKKLAPFLDHPCTGARIQDIDLTALKRFLVDWSFPWTWKNTWNRGFASAAISWTWLPCRWGTSPVKYP